MEREKYYKGATLCLINVRRKNMKTIKVTIEGEHLLMNKYNMEAQTTSRRTTKSYDPKEEAERSAYWSSGKKKELIIPSSVLYASIINASSWYKISKRSAKSVLAGSIRIAPMEISLGTDKYEIDTRPVVIQRAKVLKSRATLPKWKASFEILYNEQLIADVNIIKEILIEAGQRIGIMDFRPQRGGSFGTFTVTEFEPQ